MPNSYYLPTPKEIRKACEAIRAEWSEDERCARMMGRRDRDRGRKIRRDSFRPLRVAVEAPREE